MDEHIKSIHEFWFGVHVKLDPLQKKDFWFTKNAGFDALVGQTFSPLFNDVSQGRLDSWKNTPAGMMSFILLTDQFSRNMYRGSPKSFAFDRYALEAALAGLEKKFDKQLEWIERAFFYLPLEHAEDLDVQKKSVMLFEELISDTPPHYQDYMRDNYRYAVRHYEIISKFGRFPHRNSIVGRTSTPEEIEFLKEPNSSF